MKRRNNNTTGGGFTLVEVLVTIAIVVTIGAIANIIIMRQRNLAKDVEAAVLAQHFAICVEEYEEEMYSFPYENNGQFPDDDEAYFLHNSKVVNHMMGHDASINKDKINFMPKMKISKNGESGLVRANINGSNGGNAIIKTFADPWGNPYVVIFDHNLDGVLEGFTVGNNGKIGNTGNTSISYISSSSKSNKGNGKNSGNNTSGGNDNSNGNSGSSGNDNGNSKKVTFTATMEDFMAHYGSESWNGKVVVISAGKDGLFNKDNDIIYVY